ERGIRTPGTLPHNGFQDRRIRPLCHLSNMSALLLKAMQKYERFFILQIFQPFIFRTKHR
ncbi:MAG: hypothetical protein JXA53_02375, partial [Bacteroidales bacterium]|nr:hypothetical protein [Bacteroidales bacterium]